MRKIWIVVCNYFYQIILFLLLSELFYNLLKQKTFSQSVESNPVLWLLWAYMANLRSETLCLENQRE